MEHLGVVFKLNLTEERRTQLQEEETIVSSVLVSSVKFCLNTAPKCSVLRSNNTKNFWGRGPAFSPGGDRDTLSPHHTPLGAWAPRLTPMLAVIGSIWYDGQSSAYAQFFDNQRNLFYKFIRKLTK